MDPDADPGSVMGLVRDWEAENEILRAERDKQHADRDKEIRHYTDKWKHMGAEIDALTTRVAELRVERDNSLQEADVMLTDLYASLASTRKYRASAEAAEARVAELEKALGGFAKAIKEDHYPCPDGCVGGCEVCLQLTRNVVRAAMQKGEGYRRDHQMD